MDKYYFKKQNHGPQITAPDMAVSMYILMKQACTVKWLKADILQRVNWLRKPCLIAVLQLGQESIWSFF